MNNSRKTLLASFLFVLSFFLPAYVLAQSCVQPPPDIVAWWPFDEAAGTTAHDIVGFNDGAHLSYPQPSPGIVGGSLRFDGNDYVAVPDSTLWNFGADEFTIEFWANFDVPGSGSIGHPGDVFISNDEGPFTVNKWFFALGGGVLNFHVNGPSTGSFFSPRAPFSPIVGRWYHLAITRTGTDYSIYVDGQLSQSGTNAANIPDANAILTIGRALEPFGGFMNGRLDEMTIYQRALSEPELRAIADAGAAGKCNDNTLLIRPQAGGDTGSVTVTLTGTGFDEGTVVHLVRSGEEDVIGNPVKLLASTTITTTFDLTGKARGLWDVMVTNPDGISVTLEHGFTIEEGSAPELWVDIIGLSAIRLGGTQRYWITYGNRGNVDAEFSYVLLRIPDSMLIDAGVPSALPRIRDIAKSDNFYDLGYAVPNLPAASSQSVPLSLTANTLSTFDIAAGIGSPISGETAVVQQPEIDRYPPVWDWTTMGTPPPGYIVLYDDFGGTGSSSLSLGDGKVIHFFPDRPASDRFPSGLDNGMNVHDYDVYEPAVIWRPPSWNPATAEARRADFCLKWGHCGDWENGTNIYDEKPTSYSDGKDNAFPNTNCTGSLYKWWPELREELRGGWVWPDRSPGELNQKLFNYWDAQGYNPREYGYDGWKSTFWSDLFHEVWDDVLTLFRTISGVGSYDPNDKMGSQGAGVEQYISGEEPLRYAVFFENLETATAPAQEVLITDQLDTVNMDLSTFSFGPISFGDTIVTPPPGLRNYSTDVDLRPDNELIVRIEANLDTNTGQLGWRFSSIDPTTGLPTEEPLAGFLPPNVTPPEGDGSVLFTVMPKDGLATETVICNQANIVFDTNDPIVTPEWCNTLDNEAPASAVLPLEPTQTSTTFEVHWAGTDVGSGIGDYTIYVSEDGAPANPWLTNTPETMGLFSGENGKTYDFYSVARDRTGNRESVPEIIDATTVIATNQPPVARCQDVAMPADEGVCSVASASVDNGSSDPDGDPITLTHSPAAPYELGDTAVTLTVTDDSGASDTCTAIVTVQDTVAPTIDVSVTPDMLWAANHKLVPIETTVTATDLCDASPSITLSSVTMNEGDNALGDGNTSNDIVIGQDGNISLRAERAGTGEGRIYTITYDATDASGNTATGSATVTVPHSKK